MAELAETGKTISKWTCRLSKLDANGNPGGDLADQTVTVGEKFLVSCEGASVDLNSAKLSLEVPEKAKYALRILEVRSFGEGRGEFVATTWIGAPIEFKQLILTDGTNKVDLGPLKINVQSVLPAKDASKNAAEANPAEANSGKPAEPEPFGPYAPVSLGLPLYVWLTVAVFVVLIGLWVTWFGLRIFKQRRLKKLLAKNQVALSPFNHLNKELRRLARSDASDSAQYVKHLREAFRWYLAREFVVPAIDGTPKAILKNLARSHGEVVKPLRRDLNLALTELDKALNESRLLNEADLTQLTELCRSIADRLEIAKKRRV